MKPKLKRRLSDYYLNPYTSIQQAMDLRQRQTCYLFLQIKLYWNTTKPLYVYMAAFSSRRLDGSVVTESSWLAKPNIFAAAAAAKSLQSCPTLCDPRDSSPPVFPVPGVLQARTLEWVAISFSNA